VASAFGVSLVGVWELSVEALPTTLRVVTFGAIVLGSLTVIGWVRVFQCDLEIAVLVLCSGGSYGAQRRSQRKRSMR